MAIRAGELWRALEQLTGNSLLTPTGRLDHGNQRRVKQLHVTLEEAGVAHEILSAETAAICWPHMHFETDVLYVPESGVIDPEFAITAMLRLASELGVEVSHEMPVAAVEPSDLAAAVAVRRGRPAAADRHAAAGLPLRSPCRRRCRPLAGVVSDGEPLVCGLPGGRDGLVEGNMKVAEHTPGVVTTADARDYRVADEGRRRVVDHVRRWWPGLVPEPLAEYSAYTR